MSLARAWTRALFGASGAALLVPGTVAAVLAVLALAGGFTRIGSIGQAVSGPPSLLPAAPSPAAARGARGLGVALNALGGAPSPASHVAGAGRRGAGATAGGATGGSGGVGGRGRRSGGTGAGGGRGSGGGGGGGSGSHGGPGGGRGGGAGNAGAPPPTAPPTVVDGVVATGTRLTSQLPGPVGSVATATLQSLGSTLDRVLPLRLPGPLIARASPPLP